jgi:hypothetical protein
MVFKLNDDEGVISVDKTEIQWKENKDPTIVTKKKKKKGKKNEKPEIKIVVEDCESFFTIFKKMDNMDEAKELVEFFKDDLIPNSMEYYLNIMGDVGGDEVI